MTVSLDIFADPVCPWCLIGKAELDLALDSRPDHPFAIVWRPFRLNPDMPAQGMDRGAYLRATFRDEAGIVAAHRPLLQAAERLGITLNPAGHRARAIDRRRAPAAALGRDRGRADPRDGPAAGRALARGARHR